MWLVDFKPCNHCFQWEELTKFFSDTLKVTSINVSFNWMISVKSPFWNGVVSFHQDVDIFRGCCKRT